MRTALRDHSSQERVDLYCCDKRMVDFLLQVFPEAQTTQHDIHLQLEKLDDKRKANGGSRAGAGRKAAHPLYFTETDKRAYRRYLKRVEDSCLSHDEWYQTVRNPHGAAA